MIYLCEHADASITARVIREWNSGQRLSDAYHYLNEKYGYTAREVNTVWSQIMEQWGYAPVGHRPREEPNTDPAYTDWKGITGPGKKLRKIIQKCIK